MKLPAPTLVSALLTVAAGLASAALPAAVQAQGAIDKPATVRSLQMENPTLKLALSPRTKLVYEPAPSRPWADNNPANSGAPAEARLGLEFRTSSSTANVRHVLRMQLTAQSALQFPPRGGGLTVTYREQF